MAPYCVQYSFPDPEKEDGTIIILTLKITGEGEWRLRVGNCLAQGHTDRGLNSVLPLRPGLFQTSLWGL